MIVINIKERAPLLAVPSIYLFIPRSMIRVQLTAVNNSHPSTRVILVL